VVIYVNFNTPCLINYLGSRICVENDYRVTILFLEEIKYLTFLNYLHKKESLNFEEVLSILFQIYYTLICFNRFNLRHNDLHFNNILLEELSEYTEIYFEVPEIGIVKIKTKFIVKIYDYDRSSALYPGIDRNTLLDVLYCNYVGSCNKLNSKYDTYKVTMDFKKKLGNNNKSLFYVINQFYDDKIFIEEKINNYNLLKSDRILPDNLLKTNEQILKIIVNNSNTIKIIKDEKEQFNNIIFKPPEQIKTIEFKFKPKREIKKMNTLENIKKYQIKYDFDVINYYLEAYYNKRHILDEFIRIFESSFPYTNKISKENLYVYKVALTILLSKVYYDTVDWLRDLKLEKDILNAIDDIFVIFKGVLPIEITILKPVVN
jgi:hypothetical protein